MGNRPEGSFAPEIMSNKAWSCTPKLAIMPDTSFSNSATTAGLPSAIATITGLPPIAVLVSKMVFKSVVLEAVKTLPLYERLVLAESTTGSPAAMLCALANSAV